jgi:iron complex outermembrane receptor protein
MIPNWLYSTPVSCLALAASIVSVSAQAQTASQTLDPQTVPSDDSANPKPTEGTGDIVVTAQRRSERQIDVPISMTVASAKDLATAGVDSTRGLAQITPGLLLLDAGQRLQPSIRGITSQGTNAGEESNVSFYIDEAYVPSQSAALFQLGDVERVEVLKGPQGTLFGRNATGGAIRITTRDPGHESILEVKAKYGFRQNDRELSVYGAAPVANNLSASIATLFSKKDGYIRNLNPLTTHDKLGATEGLSGRVKLLYEPTTEASFMLSADYVNVTEEAAGTIPVINGQSIYKNRPGVIIPLQDYETSYSQIPYLHYKGWGTTFVARLQRNNILYKSVSAYRRSAVPSARNDVDRTNLSLQANDATDFLTTSFSEDLNISFNNNGPISWTAGAFYLRSDSSVGLLNYNGDVQPGNLLSGRIGRVKTDAISVFGELTYRITDRLSVTGGLRYSYEGKRYAYTSIVVQPAITFSARDHWQNISYRAVVNYKVSTRSNLYFVYSTGFKAGTFNTSIPSSEVVNPETVNALELGVKTNIFDRAYFTFALFDYRYKNIQTIALIQDTQGTRNALANAAAAKVQGAEVSFNDRFGPFELNVGASWLPVAKYTSFPGALVYFPASNGGNTLVSGVDISGSRMVRAPKFTGNAALSYRRETRIGVAGFAINYAYNSGFGFVQGAVVPAVAQGSYGLLNANLSLETVNRKYKLSIYGENLTSQVYRTYIVQTANGDSGTFGRPIELGVRLEARF